MIAVDDFHKAFDGVPAVAGLSFEVAGGEILGLIGPNGAGKTTTLRSLSGMTPPTRGRMTIDGFDVEQEPLDVKRRIAYVPDEPHLFPNLSVLQHLALTATAFGVADPDDKAADLLHTFELVEQRDKPARELSRGMRQKLAICCAYLHDPLVLMFDEPLTGLDPLGIRRLKESIVARATDGAAVIVSSHLLAMVEDICTQVLILDSGTQRFFGPLGELQQKFVASEQAASLERIFFLATETEREPDRAGFPRESSGLSCESSA